MIYILSLGCVCWDSRHVEQFFTAFSISVFIWIQQRDLHSSSLIFSIPVWLWYSCSSVCFCSSFDLIIHLPFLNMPSVTNRLSLKVRYGFSCCGISFLLTGQPYTMKSFSCCRWSSWSVTYCISFIKCILGCTLLCVFHKCLSSCWVFCCLYLLCDLVVTTSQVWKSSVKACIVFWFCTSGSSAVCTEVSVIQRLHLSWKSACIQKRKLVLYIW